MDASCYSVSVDKACQEKDNQGLSQSIGSWEEGHAKQDCWLSISWIEEAIASCKLQDCCCCNPDPLITHLSVTFYSRHWLVGVSKLYQVLRQCTAVLAYVAGSGLALAEEHVCKLPFEQ